MGIHDLGKNLHPRGSPYPAPGNGVVKIRLRLAPCEGGHGFLSTDIPEKLVCRDGPGEFSRLQEREDEGKVHRMPRTEADRNAQFLFDRLKGCSAHARDKDHVIGAPAGDLEEMGRTEKCSNTAGDDDVGVVSTRCRTDGCLGQFTGWEEKAHTLQFN